MELFSDIGENKVRLAVTFSLIYLYNKMLQKLAHELHWCMCQTQKNTTMKLGLKIPNTSRRTEYFRYYKCDRCGYISTRKNTECPICKKDGLSNKLR